MASRRSAVRTPALALALALGCGAHDANTPAPGANTRTRASAPTRGVRMIGAVALALADATVGADGRLTMALTLRNTGPTVQRFYDPASAATLNTRGLRLEIRPVAGGEFPAGFEQPRDVRSFEVDRVERVEPALSPAPTPDDPLTLAPGAVRRYRLSVLVAAMRAEPHQARLVWQPADRIDGGSGARMSTGAARLDPPPDVAPFELPRGAEVRSVVAPAGGSCSLEQVRELLTTAHRLLVLDRLHDGWSYAFDRACTVVTARGTYEATFNLGRGSLALPAGTSVEFEW